jgi:ectoine hydroxylase-related dioxygenase (phytanoyl-CoA dioxygenase family)
MWHVDDCNVVDFPLPDDIPRHDPRVRLPVFWLTVQIALTDITTIDDGPTEIVPGSHYAGRLPNSQETPHFDGRGPAPILCKAGDVYLLNQQVWHRGGPNTSQRTRYLLALQYAQGGTRAARYQGLDASPQLDRILEGADGHMLRVLGRTAPTYGHNA